MNFGRIADFVLKDVSIPENALDMAATLPINTIGVVAVAAELVSGSIAFDHAFAFHTSGAWNALAGLMRTHGCVSSDVARIEVNTFAQAAALYLGMPTNTSQAQYSRPFALSVMLVHGHVGLEDPMDTHEVKAKFQTMAASLSIRRAATLWSMRNRHLQSDVTYADLVRAPVEKPHG